MLEQRDKIIKEVISWYDQHKNKNDVFIEDFVEVIINKTTDILFDEVEDELKYEFEKGNLKHPFIISNDYYLYLKLKEIKSRFVKTEENEGSKKQ